MEDHDILLTQEELELLEKISPEMFTRVRANEPYARKVAKIMLANRQAQAAAADAGEEPPPAIQLPLWPENVRIAPNGFLRSALFGVVRPGRRRYIRGEDMAALKNIKVSYKGERLDQRDLDVYLTILHALRGTTMGTEYRTTAYALLKMMGKTVCGKNRATLTEQIKRLVANAVTITQDNRYSYIGSLIVDAYKDENTQEWVIVLNPKLKAILAPDQYTQLEWNVRKELSGQQLAQWLYSFYTTHVEPHPIKIETLRKLSGSETVELKYFTKNLKQALNAVSVACTKNDETFLWAIDSGLVYAAKTLSQTQLRHLAKRQK